MPFMDHMSGTDRRFSSSQHDKYRYVSCHSWITPDMWSMNGMIHTCTYYVDYKTIFCRFLTCDPWMAWYIHVLIMLTIRQSSVGSWHGIHEWHDTYMLHVCIMPYMDHMSGTDRRLSYSQHDKYRYVSCHSWITCQEPTEDCLIVNMISTVIHEWHDTYLYLSCWLEDNLLSVPDMWSMNGMIHTCTYHVD
jgi:hypothetical protein